MAADPGPGRRPAGDAHRGRAEHVRGLSSAIVLAARFSAPAAFAHSRLGVAVGADLTVQDWLTLTGQAVLEVIGGPVFHDGPGEITNIRRQLRWYPDDLWLYAIASHWARLGEELPYVGRSAERGDENGSRLVTAGLVRTAMHLGFLLERRWAPYPKWFGTLFGQLACAPDVSPHLDRALSASDWRDREQWVAQALEELGRRQSGAGIAAGGPVVTPFHDRPYRGLRHVAEEVTAGIRDPLVRALPLGVGTAEQWSDNVKVLTSGPRRAMATAAWVGALRNSSGVTRQRPLAPD